MSSKHLFRGFIVVVACFLAVSCGGRYEPPSGGAELTLASGWKLHYIEQGPEDAPVVLFAHGLGGSCEYWEGVIGSPDMENYRCLAIDMFGFGWSDKPEDFDYSMEGQADAIREFLALKEIDKVTYVGHSMAGAVGIALIKLQPDLVERLVLVDSTLDADYYESETLQSISEWGEFKFRLVFPFLKMIAKKITSDFFESPKPETIDMAARAMRQSTYYSFQRSLKELHHFVGEQDLIEFFKGLKIPHYYIFGTSDSGVARMAGEHFESESWVYKIEGVMHCPMVEDTKGFCSVLAEIMAK